MSITATLDTSTPKLTLSQTLNTGSRQIRLDDPLVKTNFFRIDRPAGLAAGAQWTWTHEIHNTDILDSHTLSELQCGHRITVVVWPDGLLEPHSEQVTLDCPSCPEVGITITPDPGCVSGRRSVHLKAEVISANDATCKWLFGADDDNQPGEDSEDGGWLPPQNANGVRVVETPHVYVATSNQPQTITVTFVTSSGPGSRCAAEQTFTLDPCRCDLQVSLQLLDGNGATLPATTGCLAPGNYGVEVTNPTGLNISFSWSVNGVHDSSQQSSIFPFALATGEQKTITVSVGQGECEASNGEMVVGCGETHTNGHTSPRPWYCFALEFLMIMALLLGLIDGYGLTCSGVTGVSITGATGGPFNPLFWIALGLSILSTSFLAHTFIELMVIFVVLALLWWRFCNPGLCRLLGDLAWVFDWAAFICSGLSLVCPISLPYVFVLLLAYHGLQWYMTRKKCVEPAFWSLPWLR
jgi:hypothetical protein